MYAIIATGGKQYKVAEGDVIKVEKLGVEAGETVTFDNVIAVSNDGLKVGEDVKDASVTASVVENGKNRKVIVYKYKRKTGYHKKNGHRQQYTKVKIEKINGLSGVIMITIKVRKKNGSYEEFISKGHAGYAEAGQDIVCAAVSALIITTVNSLEKFTDDKFDVQEEDGFVSIHFRNDLSERGMLLMDSLLLGLTEIAGSYNNRYLTVKVKEV